MPQNFRASETWQRFQQIVELFRKYAAQVPFRLSAVVAFEPDQGRILALARHASSVFSDTLSICATSVTVRSNSLRALSGDLPVR